MPTAARSDMPTAARSQWPTAVRNLALADAWGQCWWFTSAS
jgi:hypothetical protein